MKIFFTLSEDTRTGVVHANLTFQEAFSERDPAIFAKLLINFNKYIQFQEKTLTLFDFQAEFRHKSFVPVCE